MEHEVSLVWCVDSREKPVCKKVVKLLKEMKIKSVYCTDFSSAVEHLAKGEFPDFLFVAPEYLPKEFNLIPALGIVPDGNSAPDENVLEESMVTRSNLEYLFHRT